MEIHTDITFPFIQCDRKVLFVKLLINFHRMIISLTFLIQLSETFVWTSLSIACIVIFTQHNDTHKIYIEEDI